MIAHLRVIGLALAVAVAVVVPVATSTKADAATQGDKCRTYVNGIVRSGGWSESVRRQRNALWRQCMARASR
jgi:hypothetical protein